MEKSKRVFWIALVTTGAFAVGMALLGDELEERKIRPDKVSCLLSAPLKEVMEQEDSVFGGIVLIKRLGSRETPRSVRLYKREGSGEIQDCSYYEDRSTVIPGRIMQTAVKAYLIDRNYLRPQDPAFQRDSIGVGFVKMLRNSYWIWEDFMDRFEDYFGSSEACYLPNSKYHFEEALEEIFDGYGVLLSPEQVLTFWDALSNGGVRPGTWYSLCCRILSDRSFAAVRDLCRIEGSLPVIGQSGGGQLPFGFVSGIGNINDCPYLVRSDTFVGAFPADEPKYTMSLTLFSIAGTPQAVLVQELFTKMGELILESEEIWKE